LVKIDGDCLVKHAGINIVALTEDLGRAGDQTLDVVDDTADVIRYPSRRVGRMRAPFQDKDVHIRPPASGL
jgi:hypothetical protein